MITRDRWGIPTATGSSVLEVAREQGRAIAEDRAWQLTVERHRAEGTCSALFGDAAAEWDELVRRADLAGTAQRAYAALSLETRAFVDAHAEGVNEVLEDKWLPWTPLAVFLGQHVLFSAFPGKLWKRHVRSVVEGNAARAGADRQAVERALGLLAVEGLPGGSNAVAVSGTLTQSGFPMVAGDPHRLLEAPGCYAQVRLVCTDPDDAFDVTGFCFPGVPGVQHFGRAAHADGAVAWGITNAVADDEDVDPVTLEVRTPTRELGDVGFETLLPLLRSRAAEDVVAAFGLWVSPVDNLLVADSAGVVEHHVVGRVPVRGSDGGWRGWVDPLPRRTGDVLVTANDRADASWATIGSDFAPPHRAHRIAELVQELIDEGPLAPSSLSWVLADVRQTAGAALLDVVAGLDPADLPDKARPVRERLLAWDREMSTASAEAALFAAVREAVVDRLAEAPLLAGADTRPHGELLAPWFDLRGRLRLCLPALLAAGRQGERPFGADPAAAVAVALEDVAGADPAAWGDSHLTWPLTPHEQLGLEPPPGTRPPVVAVPGDDDCVFATRAVGGTGVAVHGPVARYVWDLAPADDSLWVVPLGASGEPGSAHHHDQQAAWAMGGQVRVHHPHRLTRGEVVVRPVDPYGDAAALHEWTTAERAEFWGMRGMSVEEVAGIYSWIDAQPHLTANALEVGGRAVGILQTYDPFVDEIGQFYDRRPGDVGIHLLLDDGPARRGRTNEVLAAGLAYAAGIPGMERLVLEPDARNRASIALLDRLGAERGPLVELKTSVSEKPAQFFFLGIEAVRGLVEREAASVPQ